MARVCNAMPIPLPVPLPIIACAHHHQLSRRSGGQRIYQIQRRAFHRGCQNDPGESCSRVRVVQFQFVVEGDAEVDLFIYVISIQLPNLPFLVRDNGQGLIALFLASFFR
jgi:hypothetical protein